MEKRCYLLNILLSVFTMGTIAAKDIVVCGTVTDLYTEKAPALGAAAPPCSVSVSAGCAATTVDRYFAKTNATGYYSLSISLPDSCTNGYLFTFKGKKQNLIIATTQVVIPKATLSDTLRQNLQLTIIDDAMPNSIPAKILADWIDQDGIDYITATDKIKTAYPAIVDKITASGEEGYKQACHWRRVARMKPYEAELENIMFARHHNFGGVEVGYHDNSDASNSDDMWASKGALCVLTMKNYYSTFTELLTKTDAVVRDPCISFDGKKVLFAISGNGKGTGYKIYEMDIADTTKIKQLTFDPAGLANVADFEPCYLPNGDIMFTSTRNLRMNPESFSPTTNMFLMNGEGNYMRQVGFDQVHTFYPVIQDDGTVVYTRWEFNDRSMISAMGLFMMNPDGSHQTEYFGNQNSWPMTIIHARPIPGTRKVMAVAGGNHGPYAGELMIIDRSQGTNGTKSIQMIAPQRDAAPVAKKSDMAMGGVNFLFQNPCPLDETNFLVSWRKAESEKLYKLYFMDTDGHRELLAWGDQSVSQPVLIKPRKTPPQVAVQTNYNDSMGIFTMQNVYIGEGMKDVEKGTAKTLRVVKLKYRAAGGGSGFGATMGSGPSGSFTPAVICPVSAYGASWEAKEVLGEAKIYEDGSAAFKVPARTPVYFQVIDAKGYCIATMRSWSTLMPGEIFSCFGCHESKSAAPGSGVTPQAASSQKLDTPLGIENRPFDYHTMVQPIFEKNCVSCHTANHESGFDLTGTLVSNSGSRKSFTKSYSGLLKGIGALDSNKAINICTIFSTSEQQSPRSFGSSLSGIMLTGGMNGTHHEVKVTEPERKIVACWIDLCAPFTGTYNSYMSVSDSTNYQKMLDKRLTWAAIEQENIKALLTAQTAVLPDTYGTIHTARASNKMSRIRYFPKQRELVLNNPGAGTFILVDLRGKVISRTKISTHHINGAMTISLPASLGTGMYVARFEGVSGVKQTMISITK